MRVSRYTRRGLPATNAGDAAGIAALFTEDGVCVTRVGVVLQGREEIKQGHVATFSRMRFSTPIPEVIGISSPGDDSFVVFARTQVNSTGTLVARLENVYSFTCIRLGSQWKVAAIQNTGVATVQLRGLPHRAHKATRYRAAGCESRRVNPPPPCLT
jgi:uncharacterized protein (TIGR02246 family)